MYAKVQFRLTLLCTCVTGCILVIITLAYLLVAEQNMEVNNFSNFENDIQTIVTTLEAQSSITHEWLSKTAFNGGYYISIEDNHVPLFYEDLENSAKQEDVLSQLKTYVTPSENQKNTTTSFYSFHREFYFTDSAGDTYFAAYSNIAKEQGSLDLYVLSPRSLTTYKKQVLNQRLLFVFINVFAIVLLFVFFRYFISVLLKPIHKNQEKQAQFVASASHELRTPLAIILSSVSALSKANVEEQKPFYATIQSEGTHMKKLLEQMLLLANAEHQFTHLSKTNVQLDTLLLNCYEAFEPLAAQKEIGLGILLPDEAIDCCSCDKEQIREVLSILIHNAISYTPSGGRIMLSLETSGSHFILSVKDNGMGISREDKKHIFERFYRADSTCQKKEHFGLGLSIAAEIIKAHKGSIQVQDTQGGGCTFLVKL